MKRVNISGFLVLVVMAWVGFACKSSQPATDSSRAVSINFNDKNTTGTITFGGSRSDGKKPLIEWITPVEEKVDGFDRLRLELKVTSDEVLADSNFSVYVAKIKTEGKAGERSLLNKKREYIYSTSVKLDRRYNVNVIEVKLRTPSGVTAKAPLRFAFIKNTVQTKSNWVFPNLVQLSGKPYTHHKEMLKIEMNLDSRQPLTMAELDVVINGKKRKPTQHATLQGGSDGKYYFTDFVNLINKESFQTVHVEVSGQASDVLKVNFVPLTKPNLYIVAIGPKTDLKYTDDDAKDFAALFSRQGGALGNSLYDKVEVITRLGEAATAAEIKGVLEEFKTKYVTDNLKVNDVLAVFISSHGFLMGSDFRIKGDDYKNNRKESTSVSYQDDIIDKLDEIPCKKLIFIDACHSGGASQGEKNSLATSFEINQAIKKLNKIRDGFITIASSQADQYSYEDDTWRNGAFTESIIKGLRDAKADLNQNKIITTEELFKYIEREVPRLVSRIKRKQQKPKMVENDLGDIPIYVVTR